ncbi:MAG: family 43 glycosylhydrolase [Candidatus Saccharimonadaceae bacterium]
MKKILFQFILSLFFISLSAQEYSLVWSDEFEEDGLPNEEYWNYENGFVRNNELQWYQLENAHLKNGLLIIEGRKEKKSNPLYAKNSNDWKKSRKDIQFTSSSINTKGKKEFLYGRVEVRARIPLESGSWPAIWTLGRDMEWPSNGEIDIMEYYKIKDIPHILANIAWGTDKRFAGKWNTKAIPFSNFMQKDENWGDKFHIWRMDWDENSIKLFLDDKLLNETPLTETINGSLGNYANPFKQPHYLLLNLAIGSSGGEPDLKAFPLKYEIDYVRLYQKSEVKNEEMIQPAALWPDNNGQHINAHGGGLLYYNDKYYWFGEHKSDKTSAALVGITCYSSDDLVNWKYESVALPISPNPDSDITIGSVMERPKVIYNPKTGKFVMWFHLELKDHGYDAARAAVAVSDHVAGPYILIKSKRINPGVYPFDMPDNIRNKVLNLNDFQKWWTPEWYKAVENGLFVKRDLESGQMSRDMTLYVDDDGKAYHIYSSEENLTLHIAELTEDFLGHSGKYIRVAPGGHNEAPAIFKRNDIYWMISSGCTGWAPNEARMFSASSIWGPWRQHPNPCRGENAEFTFGGQSTFVQTIMGKKDAYLFMADMWRPKNPIDGRYIWLPIQFEKNIPFIEWKENWNLDFFDKKL